jgi:hypothetical protein
MYENDIKHGPYEVTRPGYYEKGNYKNGNKDGEIYIKKGT